MSPAPNASANPGGSGRSDAGRRTRPYLFYDVAISICTTCFRRVDAKIVFDDEGVFLLKHCPTHGDERVLVADDVDYYRRCREVFIKPPEMPVRYNTPVRWGCPYDCGLCTDHEQHSCLTLVEICDACNLRCPICYASSGPDRATFRSLDHVERMLDAVVRNEDEPDVVQISGGEPTIHPEFFRILDRAKARPIRHLMVNTNGVRIAESEAFAERLSHYMPDFEVYLQFDALDADALMNLRGADLRDVRRRALERLNRLGISTTLVVTVKRGVNDGALGAIVDFALQQPAVRGVTFQPVQDAGRTDGYDPARDRLTLTGVRRRILDQTAVFRPEDIIPVPCHPDALAMAYALKIDQRAVPLTGLIDPKILIDGGRNTIVFEQDDRVREGIVKLFATNHSPASSMTSLRDLLCCLPNVSAPEGLGYRHLFRIIIMQFIDAHAFDVRSVKKSCVHIVHPDGKRLIPFDTYNLFYRDTLETTRLAALRGW
jgi:7,8-dihydro-6-hydroxymethylpterin dimethyltransferase